MLVAGINSLAENIKQGNNLNCRIFDTEYG